VFSALRAKAGATALREELRRRTAAFNIVFAAGIGPFEKERVVRDVRRVAADLGRGAPGVFHLTGMHAFMETTGVEMQRDVTNFSLLSVLSFVALTLVFGDLSSPRSGFDRPRRQRPLRHRARWPRPLHRHDPRPAITMGLVAHRPPVAKHDARRPRERRGSRRRALPAPPR
jgi:hypothetical protein